jgi:hypothetical protein
MSYRSDAVRAAIKEWEEFPQGRPDLYWRELLRPDELPFKGDYCGAFILRSLQKAGLAKGAHWQIGLGFISPLGLPRVAAPLPGDIVFVPVPFGHQALVVSYDAATGMVTSIDGNQPGIEPRVRFVKNGNIEFYSIQPLIDEAERNAPLWPWLLGGAAVLGAATYAYLNPGPIDRVLKRLGL